MRKTVEVEWEADYLGSSSFDFDDEVYCSGDVLWIDGVMHTGVESITVDFSQ